MKSSNLPENGPPGLVALRAVVFTLPCRSVNQITTRLFSENLYRRSRMARASSIAQLPIPNSQLLTQLVVHRLEKTLLDECVEVHLHQGKATLSLEIRGRFFREILFGEPMLLSKGQS